MDKIKVWVVKRKRKTGNSYAVQWQDPRTGKFRTEKAGTDKAYARQKAADRRKELLAGVYKEITSISWDDFVREHLEHVKISLSAASHKQHELVLRQFKEICEPANLTVIDFSMLEKFRLVRSADKVSPATINKGFATLQSIWSGR